MEHVTLPRDLAVGLELQLELQLEVELQPKHEILQDVENVALPSSLQSIIPSRLENVTLPSSLQSIIPSRLENVALPSSLQSIMSSRLENVALPSSLQNIVKERRILGGCLAARVAAAWTMLWTMRHWQWRTSTTSIWRCSVALRQKVGSPL